MKGCWGAHLLWRAHDQLSGRQLARQQHVSQHRPVLARLQQRERRRQRGGGGGVWEQRQKSQAPRSRGFLASFARAEAASLAP